MDNVLVKKSKERKERTAILLRLAATGRTKGVKGVEALLYELDRTSS